MLPATKVEQLAQSIDLVVGAVRGAPVDRYHNPTPCSAWTVKDLVHHIAMMLLVTRNVGTRTASDPSLLTADPVPLLAGRPESEWALLLVGAAEPAAKAWSEPAAWEGEAGLGGPPMPATALGEILIARPTPCQEPGLPRMKNADRSSGGRWFLIFIPGRLE
ncbi:maleylpyruvate isomerase N-terminal domain-containing protein [Streptomyces sp. NPDC058247]|uniref:maleylpyruvate isomerase N-terminal domain-containing protein n=1 Tax=Streptomyces sp. NPDC058247 TaxID=3346401 RepID=UPI0036EFB86F